MKLLRLWPTDVQIARRASEAMLATATLHTHLIGTLLHKLALCLCVCVVSHHERTATRQGPAYAKGIAWHLVFVSLHELVLCAGRVENARCPGL